MTGGVRIGELPWWELGEVAAADARIFGPTAWSVQYYWAVAAQPGTVMILARLVDEAAAPADAAPAGETTAVPAPSHATPVDADRHAAGNQDIPGFLAGWIVMSAVGTEADVMTIATTEAARGRGIGRTLLGEGIAWAIDQGASTIHLEVDEGNGAALGLYRSLGFEEWGRRPDYYPGADAILMRRSAR
ncbi:GNAT family N-acetyltransferase [Brevibacterium casei]